MIAPPTGLRGVVVGVDCLRDLDFLSRFRPDQVWQLRESTTSVDQGVAATPEGGKDYAVHFAVHHRPFRRNELDARVTRVA